MQSNKVARHGDVSLHKIEVLPKGAKLKTTVNVHIAAYGEVTGHKHVVKSEEEFELYEFEDRLLYLLRAPAVVSHEEHRTYTIPAGLYEQKQEREEDPYLDEVRRVVD